MYIVRRLRLRTQGTNVYVCCVRLLCVVYVCYVYIVCTYVVDLEMGGRGDFSTDSTGGEGCRVR